MKNIPNILSSFRLIFAFLFIFVFLYDFPSNVYFALLIFIIAGLTDVVDGTIARRFNCISDFGKIIDPLADKTMQMSVLLCLLIKGILPLWFVIPFLIKEISVLLLGLLLYDKNNLLATSSWYGKLAVVVFYLSMAFIILFNDFLIKNQIILTLICVFSLSLTIFAFFMYFFKYLKISSEKS